MVEAPSHRKYASAILLLPVFASKSVTAWLFSPDRYLDPLVVLCLSLQTA
ncbi:hypothetical protein SAMN03080598_00979 [Algoriphagus boritolerans DSM 17298 = JCM 18970]|uniref:Uncharacterized protein n=1 Tax=Algoriphagus boritolerans DSM 17298 = JCM 18970 TaxID=1120964 RepID=A0A1H5TWC8_9BACT|nr:hypothetical protein SAMN03080598_00979 [Algoriphagus boritolerans DSM 17298 = JCM 18970]